MLAAGGEKSYGAKVADEIGFVATNVQSSVIPDAGHWVMEENAVTTTQLIPTFLK